MALTLQQMFDQRNNTVLNNRVAAACWKYAKTLVAGGSPTSQELKLAKKLLSDDGCGAEIGIFQIGVAVILDDGPQTDADVETAVATVGTQLITLETP